MNQESAPTQRLVDVYYEQPKGYKEGAYIVKANLDQKMIERYRCTPLAFGIPKFDNRNLIIDEPRHRTTNNKGTSERGRFDTTGKWSCHVYASALPEKEIAATISDIIVALEVEMNTVLIKLLPSNSETSSSPN